MRVGVFKFCHHLEKEFEDVDYSVSPIIQRKQHPPNCFHSYAAATNGFVLLFTGSKEDYNKALKCDMAIILVNEHIFDAVELCHFLKNAGKVVLLGFHENMQALQHCMSKNINYISEFVSLLEMSQCDALYCSTSAQTNLVWNTIAQLCSPTKHVEYLPIYFNEQLSKKYVMPYYEREGIIIGTRVFNAFLMRNTLFSMIVAANLSNVWNIPVTFVLRDANLSDKIQVIKEMFNNPDKLTLITNKRPPDYTGAYMTYPLDYMDWLKLIARHKICLNIDWVMSQGDVPGDCLFTNVPCVGGNGDIQRIVSPDLGYDTSDLDKIYKICERLITDDTEYQNQCNKINHVLETTLSFGACNAFLKIIYDTYKNTKVT